MGLIITISQRGKGSVIEDRWYGQNHTTSKWGETADNNIDHMLDQEQRREKLGKKVCVLITINSTNSLPFVPNYNIVQ